MWITHYYYVLLFIASAGLSRASPRPVPAGHVIHEARDLSRQQEWVKRSRIDHAAVLPVRIGLSQGNLEKGHDLLMELSHPDSPKYGQWWTPEEVRDFFAPAQEVVDLVRDWIKSVGISDERIVHSENKGWLAVDATAKEAEMLLATEFYEYEHGHNTDELRVGTDSYHLPEHLVQHIDYVSPGVKMTRVKKRQISQWGQNPVERSVRPASGRQVARSMDPGNVLADIVGKPAAHPDNAKPDAGDVSNASSTEIDPSLEACWYNVTLTCVRAMYGIPSNPQAVEGHSLGLFEKYVYFDKPTLDMFYTAYAQWVPNGTYPIPALINGGQYDTSLNQNPDFSEANVDIFISQPLIYPQNVTLYSVDDPIYAYKQFTNEDGLIFGFDTFLDAIDGSYCTYSAFGQTGNEPKYDPVYPNPNPKGYQGQLMCGVYKPTKVISISYGMLESVLPVNYIKRTCNEFLKLGLMGTSILAATSDWGVAESGYKYSYVCNGPDSTIFAAGFPVSCPYITAVGGTLLPFNGTVHDPEIPYYEYFRDNPANVTDYLASGGGFSNIFPPASYQKAALQEYFDKHNPPYPYYEQFEPDFSKVKGLYNRIGRGYPDVAAIVGYFVDYAGGKESTAIGTSIATPIFASVLTLINQERALAGKNSVGFVNPILYAHPEILKDIDRGSTGGCGTAGFEAVCGWDPTTGLGTPDYVKMRDFWLSLP